MRLRKPAFTFGKIVLATTFFLILLEIGIRLVAPIERFAMTPNVWDPVLGIKMKPGTTGFIHCPEYEIEIAVNSKGLRDVEREYEKPAGTRRILCLGDSFTCGFGVTTAEAFPHVLQELLDRNRNDTSWEVVNAGVGNTGTAHHLAYFESEGHSYDPDLVLLTFAPNDFWDNMIAHLYTTEGDSLVRHRVPQTGQLKLQKYTRWIPGYNTVFAHSHTVNTLKHQLARLHYRSLGSSVDAGDAGRKSEADKAAAMSRQTEFAVRLVTELAGSCRERGIQFALAIVPLLEDAGHWHGQVERLVEAARVAGILVVDLRPHHAGFRELGIEVIYPEDGHWNARGHALYGEIIAKELAPLLEP